MFYQIFCQEATKSGVVIAYVEENGNIFAAADCHPWERLKTSETTGVMRCGGCSKSLTNKYVDRASRLWTTEWTVDDSLIGTRNRNAVNWIADWTGLQYDDIELEVTR